MALESLSTPSSWVITRKADGAIIMETFNAAIVRALNTERYEAVPILQHLQRLNASVRAG